jgi:hypothetical protein
MRTATQLKKSLATALQRTMKTDRLTVTAVAGRIGCDRKVVRRLLDPNDTAITFKTVEKVTKALNLHPKLTIRPLPLKKLQPIAARLASTDDNTEASLLRKQFLEGYYGKPVHLANAKAAAV